MGVCCSVEEVNAELYEIESYECETKDSKMNGKGSVVYVNGDRYEGEFVNNQMNGYGKYTHLSGDVFEGEFKENVIVGKGVEIFCNG